MTRTPPAAPRDRSGSSAGRRWDTYGGTARPDRLTSNGPRIRTPRTPSRRPLLLQPWPHPLVRPGRQDQPLSAISPTRPALFQALSSRSQGNSGHHALRCQYGQRDRPTTERPPRQPKGHPNEPPARTITATPHPEDACQTRRAGSLPDRRHGPGPGGPGNLLAAGAFLYTRTATPAPRNSARALPAVGHRRDPGRNDRPVRRHDPHYPGTGTHPLGPPRSSSLPRTPRQHARTGSLARHGLKRRSAGSVQQGRGRAGHSRVSRAPFRQVDGRSAFAGLTTVGRNAVPCAWPVHRQAIRRRPAPTPDYPTVSAVGHTGRLKPSPAPKPFWSLLVKRPPLASGVAVTATANAGTATSNSASPTAGTQAPGAGSLIGMTNAGSRADYPDLRQTRIMLSRSAQPADRRILAHGRRSALVTNCDPIPGLTPSFGATAPGVQGGKAGAPDCGTVSQCLDGQVAWTSVTDFTGWSAKGHPRASSSSSISP